MSVPSTSQNLDRIEVALRSLRSCQATAGMLLALGALAAWPAAIQAAWLGFRNDTRVPVIVQCASVVKGQVRWGKAHSLYPGEVSWDSVIKPGSRQVVIYDAKKRVLLKTTIACKDQDLFYSFQAVAPGKVRLVPTKPPKRESNH